MNTAVATPQHLTPFPSVFEPGQETAQRVFLQAWVNLMKGPKLDVNEKHFSKRPQDPAFAGIITAKNFTPTVDDMRLATSVIAWVATQNGQDVLQFGRDVNGVLANISDSEKPKRDHVKHHPTLGKVRESFLKASKRKDGWNRRISYIAAYNMADYERLLSSEGVSLTKKLAGHGDVNERTRLVIFQTLGWLASGEGNTFFNEAREELKAARAVGAKPAQGGYRASTPATPAR